MVNRASAANASVTASRVYDAECAFRAACQSCVEEWIAAASASLQRALRDYLATAALDAYSPTSLNPVD